MIESHWAIVTGEKNESGQSKVTSNLNEPRMVIVTQTVNESGRWKVTKKEGMNQGVL